MLSNAAILSLTWLVVQRDSLAKAQHDPSLLTTTVP
jgi:hypothetical protein